MVQQDILTSLNAIRAHTQMLNKLADNAAEVIRQVEGFLKEAGAGGRFAVRVSEEEDEVVNLEYRRVGPRYRIAVVVYPPGGPEAIVQPWSESSRDIKLETFQQLPELLKIIAQELRQRVEQTLQVSSSVTEILKAISTQQNS